MLPHLLHRPQRCAACAAPCHPAELTLPNIAFATVAGLRGALTLIMAADFIIHSDFYSGGAVGERGSAADKLAGPGA